MTNNFAWLQLQTSDAKKAESFYGQLFKWTMNTMPVSGGYTYTQIDAGEGSFAGITQGDTSSPPQWISYITVDDIKSYTEKAQKLGAQIIVPVTDIGGGQGYYSVFKDPTGAILGLYGQK